MNNYFLAWAKDEKIREKGRCGGFITALLKFMLEKNIVDYVLTVKKGENFKYTPILTSNPEEVVECSGYIIYATPNIAKLVMNVKEKIAIVCKSCDARAIIELAKRNQIDIENVFMIGLECKGTFLPTILEKILKNLKIQKEDVRNIEILKDELLVFLKNGDTIKTKLEELEKMGLSIRENCKRCEFIIPRMCDLACGRSTEDKTTFIEVCSKKGEEIIKKALEHKIIELKEVSEAEIKAKKEEEKFAKDMAKKWQDYYFKNESLEERRDFWFGMFNRCIKCYACRDVCPICYCIDCILNPWRPLIEGGKVPPSPSFHITRIIHVAESCVNCGQCQDVCPVEIPISRIMHKLNKAVQEKWGYIPGISLDDKPPTLQE